jgi:hypothetical protein
MTHVNPIDVALVNGVGDPVQCVANDSVAGLYTSGLQRFYQYIGYSLAHREPHSLSTIGIGR